MKSLLKFLPLFLLCLSLDVFAKDAVIYKTASGIQFVNGGIGEEQASNIRQIANQFSLHLQFSGGEEGAWLTEVSVYVIDSNNKTVFSKKSGGPLLYIDLPAGDYQIVGKYHEAKQSVRLSLAELSTQKVILNWKEETELTGEFAADDEQ